jgi:hypothetical protein
MLSTSFLGPAVEFVESYCETGEQGTFFSIFDADTSSSVIVFGDAGMIAGHLLAHDDVMPHNSKRYIVSELVEEHIA